MNTNIFNTISAHYADREELIGCDNCGDPVFEDFHVYTGEACECATCGAESLTELAGAEVKFIYLPNGIKAEVGGRPTRLVVGGMPGYNEIAEVMAA